MHHAVFVRSSVLIIKSDVLNPMNPAAKGVRHWLLPILIFVLGTGGSWSLSQAFRQDALRAWQAQVEQTAHALSGTLLGWLEESYAPLSGLAILFENSREVTQVEFLGATDALEARATAFFLDQFCCHCICIYIQLPTILNCTGFITR